MEKSQLINLIGVPEARLKATLAEWGIAPYRALQVLNWIYNYQVERFDEMTNLSKDLRGRLARHYYIELPKIAEQTFSKDGTIKYLFDLANGSQVESVWMPDKKRNTLCISTQVGCRLACSFCLTGTLGLKGNLSTAEIIGQYMAVNRELPKVDQITNIVFMGMGEPLDNYHPVCEALRLMTSPRAMRISNRRITLSTAGLVDKIEQFKNENLPVNLAISLNATEDSTRNEIMPINKKYPIRVLLDCLRSYPLKPTRRITFEYVLLKGINDTHGDAKRLAKLLHGIPSKINLIPFNGFAESDYQAPAEAAILAFQKYLLSKNYSVFIRKNRGTDILGACGQLAARSFKETSVTVPS